MNFWPRELARRNTRSYRKICKEKPLYAIRGCWKKRVVKKIKGF